MQILVTIGSGVSEGAGVEFPTFPLTCVVVLKTLRIGSESSLVNYKESKLLESNLNGH